MLSAIALVLLGQFFGPQPCRNGQNCSVNTLAIDTTAIPSTCTVGKELFYTFKNGGQNQGIIAYCDGLSLTPYTIGAAYAVNGANSIFQVGKVVSHTVGSGVITNGANWLGSSVVSIPRNAVGLGAASLVDYMTVACATAGTGAGNWTVTLENVGPSPYVIVTAMNVPCATASLVPVIVSKAGAFANGTGGFGADLIVTKANIAGCTTPPADCVITHDLYGF